MGWQFEACICLLLAGVLFLAPGVAGCAPRPAPLPATPPAAELPVVAPASGQATPGGSVPLQLSPVETAAAAPAAPLELYVFYSPL